MLGHDWKDHISNGGSGILKNADDSIVVAVKLFNNPDVQIINGELHINQKSKASAKFWEFYRDIFKE